MRVLVTGAAGNIGSHFAHHAPADFDLRLLVRDAAERATLAGFADVVVADITDANAVRTACEGVEAVLHLAGNPAANAEWGDLLQANIIGTYNVLTQAQEAGCRRLVFASSIHAVSGHEPDVQVRESDPVNPGDLYGVSKCFGEALGRYLAEQKGMSVIAVRIGAFQPIEAAARSDSMWMMDAFVSRRDLQQLLERALVVENVRFAIVHGLSGNRFKRLDISGTRTLLGYQPLDDFTEIQPELRDLHLAERVQSHDESSSSR